MELAKTLSTKEIEKLEHSPTKVELLLAKLIQRQMMTKGNDIPEIEDILGYPLWVDEDK